jgi:hypothetical protein
MYLLFRCICPHKSSMGHLIQWVSLFFFRIPHKSSMGHLFRCGSCIYSFLIDSHTRPLWVEFRWIICSSLIGSHSSSSLISHRPLPRRYRSLGFFVGSKVHIFSPRSKVHVFSWDQKCIFFHQDQKCMFFREIRAKGSIIVPSYLKAEVSPVPKGI